MQLVARGIALALALAGLAACRNEDVPDEPTARPALEVHARGGTIFGHRDGRHVPILTVDAAVDAPRPPDSWAPEPGSPFELGTTGFRHITPSPDGDWVAWETAGVHDLLGVVPTAGAAEPTVLDFFFGSSARELAWAPEGPFLAVLYTAPSGLDELRVYDVARGLRLDLPWTAECRPATRCQVRGYDWLGAASLRVRVGAPGQDDLVYQVDVAPPPSDA